MSDKRICKYCGMELSEDIPHGLRECHLYAVARIAELEESDKHWAGNVKVCMQLIERYESDIAELEEIDRMRSESVSTLNQANANNEDEIELLEKRIAKLKAENETLKARIAELEALAQQLVWVGNDLLADNTNPVTITLFSGLAFRSKELLP